jgi:hypothetical protein
MAKVNANGGISGMIGGQLVFRRVGNETIVQMAPSRMGRKSEAQLRLWAHFKEAARYAKAQVADPVIKKAYALPAKHRTAYHAAVSDFLNPPQITDIDCTGYAGRPGDYIRICAVDDFRVTEVKVEIVAADGIPLESGNATLAPNGLEWIYTIKETNMVLLNSRITIEAFDMPRNQTTREIIL